MMEEPETRKPSRFDPSVNSHRPASGKTQDISHVLASSFKNLYTKDIIGKDTLSNLVKTKTGRSSYHDRYVEELQKAHYEYSQHVKEADVLEGHIIQARARATATERHAYETMKEKMGDVCDQKGLLMVNSAFSAYVDKDLLELNNLIAPQDYIPAQKPRAVAPAPVKMNSSKPTVAFNMHVSREPQDDDYTLMPSKVKNLPGINQSEASLSLLTCSDKPKRNKTNREKPNEAKPRAKWRGEPSADDLQDGLVELKKLKNRHSFLRNPRFLTPNAQRGSSSLVRPQTKAQTTALMRKGLKEQSPTDDPAPVFLAQPSVVVFSEYSVGRVFETTLELKNLTAASRQVRVIPPTTPYFSIGLGRFPGEGGVVAPGMSCKYTVRFAPDSLGDREDFLVVETQAEQLLVVPILARRPPPVLTLPRVLDCGYCLIGGVKFVEFVCQNVGLSAGTFCVIPKNQWPASNLRSVARTYFSEQPPFAVSPSLFTLQPGETIAVEVVFFPTTADKSSQAFTIVCDNCQVKDISIEGEGQLIAFELVSVSGNNEHLAVGEVHDLTAEHFVRFDSCNPHTVQEKSLVIRSNVHVELPFHWQIMKPNLHPLLPGETPEPAHIQFHQATDHVFQVSPLSGTLAPCQEQEFLFTFCPKELKDYHSVCHLVLRDVPQVPSEPSDNSGLQPVRTGSKVNDVIVMEIEVKGSTELYQFLLEPYAVVIPGEILISATTRRQFKMWNHSKTCIFFQWEKMSSSSHIIEVEPSTGSIEENECFDFNVIVTGLKPERVKTNVLCHIDYCQEPVTLAVEVSFKGPVVTVSVPNVDFGLLKLRTQKQTTLILTNITQMEASWTMNAGPDREDTQISLKPCRGVLPPLASCCVDVLFKPRFSKLYDAELELAVENGTGCHLSVRADVQCLQVCLLNCELILTELYIGCPSKATVTLFNQTLLPAHFNWVTQLQGKEAHLCTASFDPPSGDLGPNARAEITVSLTSHTDLELTEVTALCEVQGMNFPLVLSIMASEPKQLSVSYSLPIASVTPNDESAPTLLLDFGDDMILKRAVTRQFLITNRTAIPAAFTIEAEYFKRLHDLKPCSKSVKKSTYTMRPLHPAQAKKAEEKAHEDFVSDLLANGRGAAFYVQPDNGTLGAFETLTVDVTAYTGMWGEYRDRLICKVGDLEATVIPMQMTVKGCPLYFQMIGPRPDDQHQGPIIQFGTHVSGGDTVSRLLRINNPTMFDIRMDWETYNIDQSDGKLVDVLVACGEDFPLKDADGNEVLRQAPRIPEGNVQAAWKRNPTPLSEETRHREGEEYVSEDDFEEKETCIYPSPAKRKLFSVHIRPHVGDLSDYPYCITPQQIMIPAKSSASIHISFTPLTLSGSLCEARCEGLALGFMSLDSETAACVPGKVGRTQGLDLEPLRVDLLALVKPAVLLVQTDDEDGLLEFHASAGDLLRGESEAELAVREFDTTQNLRLKNNTEMPLHFGLRTCAPFSVIKPPQPRVQAGISSKPHSGDCQSLVLQPQHTMQVKVAFHCSLSLLNDADRPDEVFPPGVALIHTTAGHRKLKFQQDLLIHYSNNSLQTVPLHALLDLATLRLSTDSVVFGSCYVGQTQMVEVNLYSHGAHTFWKSHIDEDMSEMFTVTPETGHFGSEEFHGSNNCVQRLHITFTPREEKDYSSVVVIRSPLVKTPLTLQLSGTGSFDQVYRSNSL